MGFREPQTPGLGGLQELTPSEQAFVEQANALANSGSREVIRKIAGFLANDTVDISTPYSVEIDDYSATNITYVGKATPGSLTASAVWQIFKINESTGLVLQYADGNQNFDNIWDNRLSLSYS